MNETDKPFQDGDRVKIGKGKRVWVLKGRACAGGAGCEHWNATVEGSNGYVNRMVEASEISRISS